MDRGAWRAAVHGVAKVGHDLATAPPPTTLSILLGLSYIYIYIYIKCTHMHICITYTCVYTKCIYVI